MDESARRSAFVTGGSGFIGRRLIERLVAEGWSVSALARSAGSADTVGGLGAAPALGDLGDVDAMAAGAEGCDVTFHLAAHLGSWGSREEFIKGNVTGTRNAVEASRRAGARRFVHVGTEAALMGGEPLVGVDETAPLRPDSPALYSATKAQAEQVVRQAGGENFETVVVRPRLVWGKGDTTLLPEMVAAVESGQWAWIGGGKHLTDTTHVDNVVEGLLLAAERGHSGAAYFVTDGAPVVFRDFVCDLLRTQGVEPPGRGVPRAVAGTVASLGEALWRALPLPGEPPVTRLAFWLASQECTIDISLAREKLGYAPVVSHADGLEEMRVG